MKRIIMLAIVFVMVMMPITGCIVPWSEDGRDGRDGRDRGHERDHDRDHDRDRGPDRQDNRH